MSTFVSMQKSLKEGERERKIRKICQPNKNKPFLSDAAPAAAGRWQMYPFFASQ
jgi:hypothetical protein